MPCLSYTVHLTLYTLHCTPYTENKKYFLCFFLYLPKGIYLCLFTTSRPREASSRKATRDKLRIQQLLFHA